MGPGRQQRWLQPCVLHSPMQERTSYERLAKRVVQQERQSTVLKLLPGVGKVIADTSTRAGSAGMAAAAAAAAPKAAGEGEQAGCEAVLFGCSFAQLIEVTRKRDAGMKAASAAAAAARPSRREYGAGAAPAVPAGPAAAEAAEQPSLDGGEAMWDEGDPLTQVQEPERMEQEQQEPNSQQAVAQGCAVREQQQHAA